MRHRGRPLAVKNGLLCVPDIIRLLLCQALPDLIEGDFTPLVAPSPIALGRPLLTLRQISFSCSNTFLFESQLEFLERHCEIADSS